MVLGDGRVGEIARPVSIDEQPKIAGLVCDTATLASWIANGPCGVSLTATPNWPFQSVGYQLYQSTYFRVLAL